MHVQHEALGSERDQDLPLDLFAWVTAVWNKTEHRRVSTVRSQSYIGGLGWRRYEHVEIGVQANYTRVSSIGSDYEAFSISGALTLWL